MNIGIIIGRIGGVDGVALETEKWIEVLHAMGHQVYLLAGLYEKNVIDTDHQASFPGLSFFSPECQWEQEKAYLRPDPSIGPLVGGIQRHAETIANAIMRWLRKHKINLLIVENASSLPLHISMGLGIFDAVQKTEIVTIAHDHDFAWERGQRYVSPHKEINQMVDSVFPLCLPNVRHVVINSTAQNELKNRYQTESVVVPNVMNFNARFGEKSDYNSTLPNDLQLAQGDLMLLQATRVVRRKGIETAIELIERLDDSRIKLVISGSHSDDEGGHYYSFLMDLIHNRDLSQRVHFSADMINNFTSYSASGHKVYNLSDAYAHAAACTYFSTYEGFGNAFIEAIVAKKPIFVNNYKPVFWPDIGSKGFKFVMLEDNVITDAAVREMLEILNDKKLAYDIGEYNFNLGKQHFSYDVLEHHLINLISNT